MLLKILQYLCIIILNRINCNSNICDQEGRPCGPLLGFMSLYLVDPLYCGAVVIYVLYLDESGDTSSVRNWRTQNHFVLGGIAVHEGQIYNLTQHLDELQQLFFPQFRMRIAFHASEISSGHGRFRQLAPDERQRLINEVYNVILNAGFPNLVAFATAIHVSAVENPEQALHDTLEQLC